MDKPGYELKLGGKKETMAWTTFDDLETPQHICTASCFSIRGSVIEPEPTRKDDRDTTLSWAEYGEQEMTQAFKGARFQNLDPKSNLGETL